MKIKGITVKQVVIDLEFTPEELLKLEWFLNTCSLTYDGEDAFQRDAQDYVSKKMYPALVEVLKDLKDGSG
jgi:hypothetical protein